MLIRRDVVRKGLQPFYDGQYAIVQRSDKLYKVQVKSKNIAISMDRLKPAFSTIDSDGIMLSSTGDCNNDAKTPYNSK